MEKTAKENSCTGCTIAIMKEEGCCTSGNLGRGVDSKTGFCALLDVKTRKCRDYANRPSVCRGFECHREVSIDPLDDDDFLDLIRV